MLRSIDDDMWIADGPVVRFLRWFPHPTRMAVVRLRQGGLWVWSPIAPDATLAREVESPGPVRDRAAPNALQETCLAHLLLRRPV